MTVKDEYVYQIKIYLLQPKGHIRKRAYLILIPSNWCRSFKQIGQGLKINDFKTRITVHGHLLAA